MCVCVCVKRWRARLPSFSLEVTRPLRFNSRVGWRLRSDSELKQAPTVSPVCTLSWTFKIFFFFTKLLNMHVNFHSIQSLNRRLGARRALETFNLLAFTLRLVGAKLSLGQIKCTIMLYGIYYKVLGVWSDRAAGRTLLAQPGQWWGLIYLCWLVRSDNSSK